MLRPRLPCLTPPVLVDWKLPTVAPELKYLPSKAELNHNFVFHQYLVSPFALWKTQLQVVAILLHHVTIGEYCIENTDHDSYLIAASYAAVA
jgi:hypothetical protein